MNLQKKKRNRKPTPNGTRFGRLVIVEQAESKRTKNGTARMYLCKCDCGKTKIIAGGSLRAGLSKSCGCLHREQVAAREFKHGHAVGGVTSSEYRAWRNMHIRCSNPKASHFNRYGGRGIKVCSRWSTFSNFIQDMGLKPSPSHSIERTNNDGDYKPSNCKWAMSVEQDRNKISNRFVTFDNRTQIVTDWAAEKGIKYCTLLMRLRRGWSVEDALTRPLRTW